MLGSQSTKWFGLQPNKAFEVGHPADTFGVRTSTDLKEIAQHIMRGLTEKLAVKGHLTTLAELETPDVYKEGKKPGMGVYAFNPWSEDLGSPALVTLTEPIGALFRVPSQLTGGRTELYQVLRDELMNQPERLPLPVVLSQLSPVIDHLSDQIVKSRVNVFTSALYMPRFNPDLDVEGCVGFASRRSGLALRVVRCFTATDLMMRVDLLAGRYPESQTVNTEG